jgi:polyferredoxin
MKKLIIFRKFSQALFLSLFVYILWSTTYPLKGIFPANTFFVTNPHIMILTAISERILLPGMIFSLIMLVFAGLFGRYYCGWICPLGMIIDLTGSRGKKKVLSEKGNSQISIVKYPILAGFLIAAAVGIQVAWVLDPIVIGARFVSLNFIPTVTLFIEKIFIFVIQKFSLYGQVYDYYTTLKTTFLGIKIFYFDNAAIILVFFLAAILPSLYLTRLWCRVICPLGAIYGSIGKMSVLNRKVDGCNKCMKCVSNCRMGAIKDDPLKYKKEECVLCMDCVYDCPQNGIRFSCSRKEKV